WMPAWSPDDREILFVSADAGERSRRDAMPGLYVVSLDGRDRHIPTDARSDSVPSAAAWSPDGTRLAVGAQGALYAGRAQAFEDVDVFPFKPNWVSPSEILYTASGRIWHR